MTSCPAQSTLRWQVHRKTFLVVSDTGVVGVLRQADLLGGLHEHGAEFSVEHVMRRDVPIADTADPLQSVLELVQSGTSGLVAVMQDGRLVGMIDSDNLLELFRIHQAQEGHRDTSAFA